VTSFFSILFIRTVFFPVGAGADYQLSVPCRRAVVELVNPLFDAKPRDPRGFALPCGDLLFFFAW